MASTLAALEEKKQTLDVLACLRSLLNSPFSFVLSVVFWFCLFCFVLTKLTVLIKDDKKL